MEAKFITVDGVKHFQVIVPIEPRSSKSGKTMLLASTGGFIPTSVKDGGRTVKLSLNLMRDFTDAETGD